MGPFRFKSLPELNGFLDAASVAKYERVNLTNKDLYGNQKISVTRASNIEAVFAERLEFSRYYTEDGVTYRCEVDLERQDPPLVNGVPQGVSRPAEGQDIRDAEDFFTEHHRVRRLTDQSLPLICLVLAYGLWSDGVQMSRWSASKLHPMCLYMMNFREKLRFTWEAVVRLGYIPDILHPRTVSEKDHPSHKWTKKKWKAVRSDLFHDSVRELIRELKRLEIEGFLYNIGTDEVPEYVTVYPFPLLMTLDYPECCDILGIARGGNYPHPNYMVPTWNSKNGVVRGFGLDCEDIPERYSQRTEAKHMQAVRDRDFMGGGSIAYDGKPAVFGWLYRDVFLWIKSVDRLHNDWNGICKYLLEAFLELWTETIAKTVIVALSVLASVSATAISSMVLGGTLTGQNRSAIVWMLPYAAEGVGFYRAGSAEHDALLQQISQQKAVLRKQSIVLETMTKARKTISKNKRPALRAQTQVVNKIIGIVARLEKKLAKWTAMASFLDAVVLWNLYRFERDKCQHTAVSIARLKLLRIAAIKALVRDVPQTSEFQSVYKISFIFQYEQELLRVGRVIQFDTGLLESTNRQLRSLYHISQAQTMDDWYLHTLHMRCTVLEKICKPAVSKKNM